ncbi:HAD family hydrolase [Corynebacterium pacaense]|uniref:HAD family hydrolase n=1 Tax=Corynebacterium pacaense TaxID=1816684 RepID=UPI0009BB12D8|nr:HAD family phosphatase [Corynebacterium pacaense]
MIEAIFWDMDGTMVDSEPLWGIATFEMSEAMGRRLTPELRERTIGGSFRNTVDVCAAHAGIEITEDDYTQLRSTLFARMNELFDAQLVLNPGVCSLLTALNMRDTPMLVTTNTERVLAERAIAAVGREFFTGSITGDEVPRPKPAPDMYLAAAERVGAQPSQCLVFEDSFNGMSAAVAAGCRVIGLHAEGAPAPTGVVPLRDLHGSLSLEGVTPELLDHWWAAIEPAQVPN